MYFTYSLLVTMLQFTVVVFVLMFTVLVSTANITRDTINILIQLLTLYYFICSNFVR